MIFRRNFHIRKPLLKRKTLKLSGNELDTINVPSQYPQVIPVPLSKRPLFPGFYKSMHVTDPNLITALQAIMDKNKPYVGIFLNKQDSDSDIITSTDQVYRTGVFAQITNTYSTGDDGVTFVVYPHRRIRINDDRLIVTSEFAKNHGLSSNTGT
jgi:Lon-like ATP-dependent protease